MKLLYIVNVGNRFNSFSYSSSQAAKKLGIEFHIAEDGLLYEGNSS